MLVSQLYSDRFRTYRKRIHQVLGTKSALAKFDTLQDVEAQRFLLRTLQRPEDLISNIRKSVMLILRRLL